MDPFKHQSCIAGNKRNQTIPKSARICVPRFSPDENAECKNFLPTEAMGSFCPGHGGQTACIHLNTLMAGVRGQGNRCLHLVAVLD